MKSPRNIVVLFHRPLSTQWFQGTIDAISKWYEFATPEEFLLNWKDESYKGRCLITFDDGDKTVYENAYSILKNNKLKALLFISPSAILQERNFWFQDLYPLSNGQLKAVFNEFIHADNQALPDQVPVREMLKSLKIDDIYKYVDACKKNYNIEPEKRNMTEYQIMKMVNDEVIELGGHTEFHPILANETIERSSMEITDSINGIAKMVDKETRFFAYPNGIPEKDFGNREYDILSENGVQMAFSCKYNFVDKKSDKYNIPRIEISQGGSLKTQLKIFYLPMLANSWMEKRNTHREQFDLVH